MKYWRASLIVIMLSFMGDLSGKVFAQKISEIKMRLENGIEVQLISSGNFSHTSASFVVGAGSWDDPEGQEGLAHFVEHLVFCGTNTYREQGGLKRYIEDRGGRIDAATYETNTIYSFSLPGEDVEEVLHRFSQLFIGPLFPCSAMRNEIHVIEHEFVEAMENPFTRMWQVFKETGSQEHPNNQFSFGNSSSLKNVTREEIISWFFENYRADNIKIAIASSISLESLEKLVCRFFSSGFPEAKKKPFRTETKMSSSGQKGKCIHLDSINHERALSLLWELPQEAMTKRAHKDLRELIKTLNGTYLPVVEAFLRKEGLIVASKAEVTIFSETEVIFRIDSLLTAKGITHANEIIRCCFEALGLALQELIVFPIEMKQQSAAFFDEYEFIQESVLAMHNNVSLVELELSRISEEFLHMFNPKECIYFMATPREELPLGESFFEKWMCIEYRIQEFTEIELNLWNVALTNRAISHQEKEGIEEDGRFMEYFAAPFFVIDNHKMKICCVESKIRQEIAEVFFTIAAPQLQGSLLERCCSEVFSCFLKHALEEIAEAERFISWKVDLQMQKLGVYIKVRKEKLTKVLGRFFSLLQTHKMSPEEFAFLQKQVLQTWVGSLDPVSLGKKVLHRFLFGEGYCEEEIFIEMKILSYEDYKQFEQKAFSTMFIQGSFLGNITHEEVISFGEIFEKDHPFVSYERKEAPSIEEIMEHGPVIITKKSERQGSALCLLIGAEELGKFPFFLHQAVGRILQGAFFEEFRIKQPIAYTPQSWVEVMDGQVYYGLAIRSSSLSSDDLLEKVDSFLDEFSCNSILFFTPDRLNLLLQALSQEYRNYSKSLIRSSLVQIDQGVVSGFIKDIFSLKNQRKVVILIQGQNSFEID